MVLRHVCLRYYKTMEDLHIHMVLDGVDFRAAIQAHRAQPTDAIIRSRLAAYQAVGVTFLRDGGDAWGVGLRAKALAPEYGIDYRSPAFPIYKTGHYGGFIGRGWSDLAEFRVLIAQARREGADFIKLMLSGLMDFHQFGQLTQPSLTPTEISTLIAIAHDAGFAVMAHCNGADAVLAAVIAGVDSVEHGAYLNEETCYALAESETVWVPTLSTIGNLIGNGRFPDQALRQILQNAQENVRTVAARGGLIGLGSDAGAYCVPHPDGAHTESLWLRQALGAQTDTVLHRARQTVCQKFLRR